MERTVISKLAEVDPTFVQVVKALYGDDADPRELWDISKAIPDQSSLHSQQSSQRKRKGIAAGLLFGSAAEGLGTTRAGQSAVRAFKKPVVPNIPTSIRAPGNAKGMLRSLKTAGSGKYGKLGEFGFQAANLGVGLAAAHELLKKPEGIKGPVKPKKPKTAIGKSVFTVRAVKKEAQIAANKMAAKKGQRVLTAVAGAGATAGGVAGGYYGAKKYKVSKIPPSQSKTIRVKKNNEVDVTWEGTISKVDNDKQLVFGWCSLSKINGQPVVDLQGDYIPIEETESSAYRYVLESRKGGDMHRRVSKFDADEPLHTADLVESMVFTPEKLAKMGLPTDAVPLGWWIGMKVNDAEQWANVKAGQRLGFSIHGKGRRVEKAL